MRRVLGVAIATVLAVTSCGVMSGEEERNSVGGSETMKELSFGVSMMSDKTTYAKGDTIALELKVLNHTEEGVTFHFRDAQRYDFIIEDEKGNKVWRWSAGRMFAQVLGEETLGPGREEISYTAECEGKLEPGSYKITGVLVAKDSPMSGSVTIAVK